MIQLGPLSKFGVVADKLFHNAKAKSHGHFKRFDIDNGDGEGSTGGNAIIELYENGPSIRCRMKRGRGKRGNPRFCQTDFTSVTMVDAKCQTNNKYHDYDHEGGGDRGRKRQRKQCFVASIVDGLAGKIYHINSNGEVSERDTQDYPDEEELNEDEIAPPEDETSHTTQTIGRSSFLIRDNGVDEGNNNTSLDSIINSTTFGNNTFTVENDAESMGNDTVDINFTFDEYALHDHTLQDDFDSDVGNIPVIDVLVVYTQGAKTDAQYHSDGPIDDLVNLAIAECNLAYYNSGIHAQLNLIKLHEDTTGYSEDVNADTMSSLLYHLTFQKGSSNDPEGLLDYVHEMRENVGADMVALITTGPGCGIAWVSGNAVDALPSRSRMFSVTKYSCATGKKTCELQPLYCKSS